MSIMDLKGSVSLIDTEFERFFVVPKPDESILSNPIKSQLAAYNKFDLPRFISCFADDVVFEDADGEVLFRGHKQMFRVYAGVFKAKNVNAVSSERLQVGTWSAEVQEVKGLSSEPEKVLILYRVEEGLIRHVKMFR